MSDNSISAETAQRLRLQASKVFKPASPITLVEFFSGRIHQLDSTFEAIYQEGQHVVLFGERGVGKTSLANIIGPYAVVNGGEKLAVGKINCDGTDDFTSACRKILDELYWYEQTQDVGVVSRERLERKSLTNMVPDDASPNDIRRLLSGLNEPVVLVFDEFDRLPRKTAKTFTDLIKSLSDYAVESTMIIVGVAETVDQLVKDHASVDRALVQIAMPRMSDRELRPILTKATDKLGMQFSEEAVKKIAKLSQGLPHYTHLVGLASVKDALDAQTISIDVNHVNAGLGVAVDNAQQTIKLAYHKATTSSRKDALFEEVLTACALAEKDQLSYFQAADVVPKISKIMGRRYEIPAFARHLKEFSSANRGNILKRSGESRNIRYRFWNPLMEPYVIMYAMTEHMIS